MSTAIVTGAQRPLLMRPQFGQMITLTLRRHDSTGRDEALQLIREFAAAAESVPHSGLVAAFRPELWGEWTQRDIYVSRTVLDGSPTLKDTGGDVFLYLKSRDPVDAAQLADRFLPRLQAMSSELDRVQAGKRSDGRVVAGRYPDGITNPSDPISLAEDVLMAGEHPGAAFAFTQKFIFNWSALATMAPDAEDAMIGRHQGGAILPQAPEDCHVVRAHRYDGAGDNRKIMRQALSFGERPGHPDREEGLMFVGFCNEQPRLERILHRLMGDVPGKPVDRLMRVVTGVAGGYWYVPAAAELGVAHVAGVRSAEEEPHWRLRSDNGYMFYNAQDYLHQMSEGRYAPGDPPSPRLLSLLSRAFSRWNDGWLRRAPFPRLPHLADLTSPAEAHVLTASVALRKGLANKKTLAELLSGAHSKIAHDAGLRRIHAKELLVGVMPDFTLGRGKEVVPYLSEDETVAAWLNGELNEWSAMGHVVPDYKTLVAHGLGGLLHQLREKLHGHDGQPSAHADFYQAAIWSLEGVQLYLSNWAALCDATAASAASADEAANMHEVAARLRRLELEPPADFHDGVQLILTFHCCLHLLGELTSLGRLDQILWPLLQRQPIEDARAQEIIDCLWLKIGENAFVNRANITDYVTYGTTAVSGVGGNFPQGGGINQWVQQITVGGYIANDEPTPTSGVNPVTMLCLKAARRIPVNAPTLSLRVYKGMSQEVLDAAAASVLAGGAHPIFYQDDKLCKALYDSGGEDVTLAWSRDYAADGCYEPMLAGATEFAFANVQPMAALEQALNEGSTYGSAGPVYLRGLKQTFRSPPAAAITSFNALQEQFLRQLEWLIIQTYDGILRNYGNLAGVCPSPLLSVLIEGCVASGRDLTNAGARFHMIAPLCVGVANTIDSLYAIKKLVFDADGGAAICTLPELVDCLINDWGFGLVEPYQNSLMGAAAANERAQRYKQWRSVALGLPKWGSGNADVDALGTWVVEHMVRLCVETIRKPHTALRPSLDKIAKGWGQIDFVITPGIGTFEGYVGDGLGCGATADGRRNSMPIASDLSPTPAPQDLPADPAFRNIYQALASYRSDAIEYGLSNASPVDMNIPENFPLDELAAFLRRYADGNTGSNLVTLTCADLNTYQAAARDPERYNLLRVRMGGWTEFYAVLFPAHQEQHQRRQYFTP